MAAKASIIVLLALIFLAVSHVDGVGCAHGISGECMHYKHCHGHAVGYVCGNALCPDFPDEIM